MKDKQRKRKKNKAQAHQLQQAKRLYTALLEVASLRPKDDRAVRIMMEERGYVPNGKGGWRPAAQPKVKPTIDKEV